jgi:hypothetical protein
VYQPRAQPTFAAQPRLGARHAAGIAGALVIVAQKMKQAMKREHAQLRSVGVPKLTRLAPRHAFRYHDVAEKPRLEARDPTPLAATASGSTGPAPRLANCRCGFPRLKGQHVRGFVFPAVSIIELLDVTVSNERDGNVATQARRRDRGKPPGQSSIGYGTAAAVRHRHAKAFTVGIHRRIRRP